MKKTATNINEQEKSDTSADTLLKQVENLTQKKAAGTLTEAEKTLLEKIEKELTETIG
jgi:hypothetical protein